MSAYIQSKQTGHYLQTLGSWTRFAKEAYRFATPEAALVFCLYHEIKNVVVIDETKSRPRNAADTEILRKVAGRTPKQNVAPPLAPP